MCANILKYYKKVDNNATEIHLFVIFQDDMIYHQNIFFFVYQLDIRKVVTFSDTDILSHLRPDSNTSHHSW